MGIRDEIKQVCGSNFTETTEWNKWARLYQGEVEEKEDSNKNEKEHKTLGLYGAIAHEITKPTIIELQSEISGCSDKLTKAYKFLLDNLDEVVELVCGTGGIILKPYAVGDEVYLSWVERDYFVPLEVDENRQISKIAFYEQLEANDKIYTRVELHEKYDARWSITNRAFISDSKQSLGEEIALETVEEWAGMNDGVLLENLEFPLFSYLRYPIVNNLEKNRAMGIPCFARAINLINDADAQYTRINWEYEGGELAIDAEITALSKEGKLPKHSARLFRNLGGNYGRDGFYKVFSPQLRDTSLFNGLNEILRRIEFTCGLSYGILSNPNDTAKTATEIKISKQRFYVTVSNLQKELKKCLTHVVKILALLNGENFENMEISFDFDDSILVDAKEERQMMLAEVSAGIIKPEYYLMKVYGVEEEQAKEMMPSFIPDYPLDDGVE